MTQKIRRLDIMFDYFISKNNYECYFADVIEARNAKGIEEDLNILRKDPKTFDVYEDIFYSVIEELDIDTILDKKDHAYLTTDIKDYEINHIIAAISVDESSTHFSCIYLDFNKMQITQKNFLLSKYYEYMMHIQLMKEDEPLPF